MAFVVVLLVAVKFWSVVEPSARNWPVVVAPPKIVRPVAAVPAPIVEEAVEFKPPKKCMREVVDWSEPNLVKGKENVEAAGKLVRQSPEIQRMVVEAYWEEKRVDVALEKL